MKSINSFLRKIDVFGVPYSFKYKEKEKYTTALGGFFVILFIAAALFMGIYYFIPFYNRKNYTTVYYTLALSHTEQVNFGESETAFAVGLNCWTGSDGTTADQLFRVDHKYIYYTLVNNEYLKNTEMIGTHVCTKEDFYNRYDETFDGSQIYNYQCLDDPNKGIEGIFTSPIFAYFEFDVYAKNDSKTLLDKIDAYLIENDCKFQMFYSDNTVDISDYKEPIKSYVEAIFIQINPTLSIRRNIYYMNQYLYDDNYLIWVFADDTKERYKKTLFSRYEEYSLYQGLNRTSGSSDYLNYIKVFIRADTKRTDVKRKYQKIMEFYADASSLLIALYEILIIIFNFINNFWAEQTLSKKIFFFKDLKESGLNVKKRTSQIRELFEITGTYSMPDKISQNNSLNENNDKLSLNKKEEVKIYNSKKRKIYSRNNSIQEKENENKAHINENINEDDSDNSKRIYKQKQEENKINFNPNYINKRKNRHHKNNDRREREFDESRIETSKDEEALEEEIKIEDIEYSFNLCEIFGATIFTCCQTKELKIKNNLNNKANSFLYSKMDILLYIRNMILFDIINETLLSVGLKDVINFLSRPIISLNGKKDNSLNIFYQGYKSSNFKNFYGEIKELSKKSDKAKEEKELISLTNKHLKSLLI